MFSKEDLRPTLMQDERINLSPHKLREKEKYELFMPQINMITETLERSKF